MKHSLLAAGLLFIAAQTSATDKPVVGDMAPQINATSLSGEAINTEDYKGQNLSLVFLDSLCPMPHWPDCAEKIAQVKSLSEQDADSQWLGVAKGFYVDANWVKDFVNRNQLNFPVIWDQDNQIFSDYQVFGNPYQVWIGPQGHLVSRNAQMQPIPD